MAFCRPACLMARRQILSFSLPQKARQVYRSTTIRESSTASPDKAPRPLIEEERLPTYHPNHFHPTEPGQLLHDTYRTITKLGFGSGSTVWLAEDVRWTKHNRKHPRYVVVKIATTSTAMRELRLYDVIATLNPSHHGMRSIRLPIDNFTLQGPNGDATCLVFIPMRETLFRFQGRLGKRRFCRPLVKLYASYFLQALDYLHTECCLIHTDLKDDNILMTLENDTVLEEFVKSQKNSTPPKHARENGRTVYLSQGDLGPLQGYSIKPKLTDFDLAFPVLPDGALHSYPAVQPARYRAPEMILGVGWTASADIWNLGLMLWNLLEDVNVFNGLFDSHGCYDARAHLAQMIALLGPPPKVVTDRERQFRGVEFSEAVPNPQGKMVKTVCEYWGGPFFDDDGQFLYKDLVELDRSLEDTVTELEGEEKNMFLDFARSMLQWVPEKRKTAAELLEHPFILSLEDEE